MVKNGQKWSKVYTVVTVVGKVIGMINVIKLIAVGFIAPLILFVGTTSKYALDFIFSGNTTEAGARCGDSISQIEDSGSSITF